MTNEILDAVSDLRTVYENHVEKINLRIDEMQAKISKPALSDKSSDGGSDPMRAISKAIVDGRAELKKYGALSFDAEGSVSKSVYSTNNAAPFPVAGILEGARAGAPFRLRQMLPAIRVESGSAWVIKETGVTANVAQRTSEGTASNESTITIAGGAVPLVSFSTYCTLSEEALEDIDKLMKYLERTLAFSLAGQIDSYLLTTIRTNGTVYNANAITGFQPGNAVERIVVGAGQLQTAGYTPSVAIHNPAFNRAMGMMKASGSGEYMFGSPTLGMAEAVADMTLVGSNSQAMANFTVIDAGKCVVYERGVASIQLGRINDDFTKHLYRLRVSERLACSKVADGVAVNGAHS
ncbi:MAG: phage major capsid protein [Acidobacteria bacterium]|nr:phage major capsid protein [Acidobacteriota bacterium]